MSLEMLLADDDMHDCVVICKNDRAPALAAMEKGSSRWVQLQEAADSNAKRMKLMMQHVFGKLPPAAGGRDRRWVAKARGGAGGGACGSELRVLVECTATSRARSSA